MDNGFLKWTHKRISKNEQIYGCLKQIAGQIFKNGYRLIFKNRWISKMDKKLNIKINRQIDDGQMDGYLKINILF